MAIRTNYKQAAQNAPLLPNSLQPELLQTDGSGIVTYVHHARNIGPPTAVDDAGNIRKFTTWEEYQNYIASLKYPLKLWAIEHGKFMVASKAATALGRGSGKSVYQLWCELSNHPCCKNKQVKPKSRYVQYMLARGLRFEPFISALYLKILNEPNMEIRSCSSMIHPVYRWIMATPDGVIIDTVSKKAIRTVEWKAPFNRDAFLEIPEDYMIQIQLTMSVTGSSECDFGSFKVLDRDFSQSEFIVHRVYRNDDYINEICRVLDLFCYATCFKCQPPSAFEFRPKTHINSSMIFRMSDVVPLVLNGDAMLRNAILLANQDAESAIRST